MEPHPCLSVVVPAFDEEATLAACVERVLASPWTDEVVIVDDGSRDATLAVARDLAEHDPRVVLIAHEANQGKGAALRTGFAACRSEFVVVQDADLEYDPRDYDQLLQPMFDHGADVVYGSRFVAGQAHRVLYFWHMVGNRALTLLSNMFTDLNLTDMETGYKVFRRAVIQSIEIEEARFGFEPEITAKVAGRGLVIYEVGISYSGRTYAEGKKIGWRDGVQAVWCILRYSKPGRRVHRSLRGARPRR